MKIITLLTVGVAALSTLNVTAAETAVEKTEMAAAELALDGYCPVCYIAAGKANKGTKEFQSTYEGKTYYFVSDATKKMFEAEPTKWLPQFDGYCAFGVALGKKFETDPTVFTVVGGKVYLNKNKSIGEKFVQDQDKLIMDAHKNWDSVKMAK